MNVRHGTLGWWARFGLVGMPLVLALTACSSKETTRTEASATPITSPADPTAIEGSFDVGGYELYMECQGSGSPTVVYLHGYIFDSYGGSRLNAGGIPDLLTDRHRVCTYDRANVGESDSVPGPRTGTDSVRDLHALLEAAQVPGPYVLLGASFGGLIADMYAATYPDQVVGMVLLDASLPHDPDTDHFVPEDQRASLNVWRGTVERIDQTATCVAAQALEEKTPDIPVTYLATKELDLDPSWPVQQMTAAIRRIQRDFVAQFSPGRLVFVDTSHYMEPVIPDRIAQEVERVIEASTSG